ncbi:MAG TPA: 3-phosphoshikimate 1-carboxyvinyltransferase, partial [Polyangiaceae bacterium]
IDGRPHPTRTGDITAPLEIGALSQGHRLETLTYAIPMSSAQVKTALLLSGLYADGTTTVSEPVLSRDHTERMLPALGIALKIDGTTIHLEPPSNRRAISAFDATLPGDLSSAAFPLVAAALVPESHVTVEGVGLNPTRTGICDILRRLGVELDLSGTVSPLGEPTGSLAVRGSGGLRGGVVSGEMAVRAIDEIPIACALAARASGSTEFRDVAELRVKESDRISTMVGVLRAFGVACDELPDGLVIEGQPSGALKAAHVRSHGDHRIAMTAAVLGLLADAKTRVDDAECIMTSFPGFHALMQQLGAELELAS